LLYKLQIGDKLFYQFPLSNQNYNKKASNENWVVCPKIPLSVVLSRTSEKCENYEKE